LKNKSVDVNLQPLIDEKEGAIPLYPDLAIQSIPEEYRELRPADMPPKYRKIYKEAHRKAVEKYLFESNEVGLFERKGFDAMVKSGVLEDEALLKLYAKYLKTKKEETKRI
jgi:hypothetical protein